MNFKSRLLLLGLVSKILAANFSVVSFDGNCELVAGSKRIPMTQEPGIPLFKVTADVPINSTYKYVCGGVEDVERTLTEENTHN